MKRRRERLAKLVVGFAWVFGVLSLIPAGRVLAQQFPCDTVRDPSICGEVSPLIPMQSTEAVHMGLVWKKDSATPKILFHSRFSEYTPNDMADPEIIDLAIARGAFTTPGLQFNSSLRDVLHGFDPFLGLGTNRSADDSFQRLTYGGYLMRQGLSQAVPTRIRANRTMERQLLFDISHPDAFKNSGKFHTALLDEADFAMNRAAFAENGYSKGVFYNMYCNARVTLANGRVYVFGGHDMQSDNGLYKVNIFDPEIEAWVKRSEPCTRANWHRDPFGRELFDRNPNAPFYDNCDPRDQQSTQPSDPSDQKYARWYPSAIALPNDTVLVVGGFVPSTLGNPVGIGSHGVVLIEPADHEHRVVRQRDGRRIPACVLLVGGVGGLGALLISRIAVVIERSVRVTGEQLPAERIPVPIRSRARLGSLDPSLDLRVEDVDLVQPVVALHVVTAEDVDAPVGQGHPRVAVHVVEHALRIAVLRERGPVHGEVGLVEQGRMELPAVLERVGVADVEQ